MNPLFFHVSHTLRVTKRPAADRVDGDVCVSVLTMVASVLESMGWQNGLYCLQCIF